MYILLVLFLLIITYSYIIYLKNLRYFPGPIPLPIIGSLYYLVGLKSREVVPLLQYFKDKYGDLTLIYVLHQRYVGICHPKYAEDLLSSMEHITKGRSYQFLHSWLGDGLLTSTGQRWKMHRKFLTPAFHFNILQNFLQVFLKNEKILVRKLSKKADGKPFNLFPIIALTALDNVTESIMGVSVNAQIQTESEYVKSIETISSLIAMKMRNPIMAISFIFNLSPYKKIQENALKVLHKQSSNVIEKRREELNNQKTYVNSNNIGIKNKHAFLDLLLLSEIDGEKIDIKHVREEVDTFMFEGHDTTTSGIAFTLYCISKSEEVQEKILEEQKYILENDLTRDPTYAELKQMKYLDMVIKESMRLFPPVPFIERRITKDSSEYHYFLTDFQKGGGYMFDDISGLPFMKNTTVLVNILLIQRHPDLFDNPLEFRPERFADPNTGKHTFGWLAFSAGPRNCIGQKFAIMEMKVTIAAIIKKLKLIPVDQEPILCGELILRSENGIHVAFSKRD